MADNDHPRKISIDPITRLEGHGRIDLFLDKSGAVEDCYLVIPELRGFEKFLLGRPVEELPRLTARICGVCPEAHHAASVKTAEAVYGVAIPETAELIRRLQYNAFVAGDHATHFFALAGPDLLLPGHAPKAQRSLFGVIEQVGMEVGQKVITMRKYAHEVAAMLGGRRIHPVGMVPGGQSKAVTAAMQSRLKEIGAFMVDCAQLSLSLFHDAVLSADAFQQLLHSEHFQHQTYYMALVNGDGMVDHYDGHVRVVNQKGEQTVQFAPGDYLEHIGEAVAPWSYLKVPFLKQVGWKGFRDGPKSGVYRTAPLGMLNAAAGMQTPKAQEEYERFFDTFGGGPVHHTLAYHWARLIEMLQCAELVAQHAADERLTDTNIRVVPEQVPGEGIGVVEAPRGLLLHHYRTDTNGIVTDCNLIVGTTHNYAPLQLTVKKAALGVLEAGCELSEVLLNKIEMAFRAYDPCLGCATHARPGKMPLLVNFRTATGEIVRTLCRRTDGTISDTEVGNGG